MRNYETLIVLQPQASEEEIAALLTRIKDIIEADGTVESVEEWGKRTLAYEIDKQFTEGYYVLINFKASPSVLPNLEHLYKITGLIIRDIVVHKDK